ncbi:MAG TPA: serine protease, partial [Methylomirabilota bacterium]|nr:serine protease [Methylomirabilota bacterium]
MRLFEAERVVAAGKRYAARCAGAEDARYAERTEGRPALKRRKDWLSRSSSRDRARAAVFEAEARGVSRSQDDTLRSLSQERIIGDRDLLDFNYLELAIAVGRAVCRLRLGAGAATGFLVGPRVLLTNHHVIESRDEARRAVGQFDYQDDRDGELLPVQAFALDPDLFFLTDPGLDFTLVGVAARSTQGRSLQDYPWLKLIRLLGKADLGDPINIIQHPRGGLKQIALRNNRVVEIPEGKRDFLYYVTDTEPGSSGSPCFNDQWELIALHHSGVPRLRDGVILKKDGTPWREGEDPGSIDWIANEGARVSAIVDTLTAARLEPQEEELRARLLDERAPNPVELVRAQTRGAPAPNPPAPAPNVPASAGAVSLTVPLTVTVSLGTPAAAPPAAPAAPVAADSQPAERPGVLTEAVVIDPDWSNREGYEPDFLGVRVPLPKLSAAMKAGTAEVPP